MSWHKQDTTYLVATLAAAVFAAWVIASSFGFVEAPTSRTLQLGAGEFPLPLVAPAEKSPTPPRTRIQLVFERVPATQAADARAVPSPSVSVATTKSTPAPVATPVGSLVHPSARAAANVKKQPKKAKGERAGASVPR